MSKNRERTATQDDPSGGRRDRRPDGPSREAEILRLAWELRAGGVAEMGLGFALRTLGAPVVGEALADTEPFGRSSRLRAARSDVRDERAAWTILSACQPVVVKRRLQAAGVASNGPRVPADRRPGPRSAGRPELRVVGGTPSPGDGALRTSIGEQLAPIAAALFGQANAA